VEIDRLVKNVVERFGQSQMVGAVKKVGPSDRPYPGHEHTFCMIMKPSVNSYWFQWGVQNVDRC